MSANPGVSLPEEALTEVEPSLVQAPVASPLPESIAIEIPEDTETKEKLSALEADHAALKNVVDQILDKAVVTTVENE